MSFLLIAKSDENVTKMTTFLIADDHEIIRSGIRMMLSSMGRNFEILEAGSCADILSCMKQQKRINFAVLDMFFPDGNILSITHSLIEHNPQIKVLIYSMSPERIYGKRFLSMGVKGFLSKGESIETLELALNKVIDGEVYMSPNLQESIVAGFKQDEGTNPIDLLSNRELEVAEYLLAGMGTKEIAIRISLDITTVSVHKRRILKKLAVENLVDFREKYLLYKEGIF